MDRHSLRVLEFPHLLRVLEALAVSGPGRQAARQVHPGSDRQEIETWLGQVTELKEYLQIGNNLYLSGIEAVGEILSRVTESGQVLLPESLLKVSNTLETTRVLHALTGQCEHRYPRLAELLGRLQPLPDLEARISRSIDEHGHIRDEASPELSRIRAEIGRLRERLHSELSEILERQASRKTLQEKLITLRSGRMVIPLRSDARGALEGIVHDTSQSGATAFVEPLAVVPLNNSLNRARSRELEEESRILRELTEAVMAAGEVLSENERWLGAIDCLHAKVLLSSLLQAGEPELNDGDRIRLLQAVHPILALQKRTDQPGFLPIAVAEIVMADDSPSTNISGPPEVVPIDLHLSREQSTLIISGANTGGKTVSLKTLGLLGAMVQAGLHIPVAEGSEWPVLTGIYAEIGDEQDLRAHLSTFSARIQRLVHILDQADSLALVLLDEIGTGTDPAEGAALALGILDELRARKPFIAVTTHYHLIKAYGMAQEGVENVAVDFDEKSGRPTYRLIYGYPGASNALQIARDLSLPPGVIEATRRYLDRDQQRTIALIQELEDACRKAETEREKLREQRQQMEIVQEEFTSERDRLVQSREAVLIEAKEKAERLLSEAEKELKSVVRGFQKQGAAGAMQARKKVRQIRETLSGALESQGPRVSGLVTAAAEGQTVRLRGMVETGILLQVKEDGKRAEVQMGPKRVEVDASVLELLPAQKEKASDYDGVKGVRVLREHAESCLQRLDLVGLRVEDALPLLDRAIDRALLDGCPRIHVVHGHGTGRLRRAVHEFLTGHSVVKEFYHERQERGGAGVTVVELK
jgi:DNA mismatch repair protein MutS2